MATKNNNFIIFFCLSSDFVQKTQWQFLLPLHFLNRIIFCDEIANFSATKSASQLQNVILLSIIRSSNAFKHWC